MTIEPDLDWADIVEGRSFREVSFTLDDESVDRYLDATGEWHPLYQRRPGGLAPPLYTTLVRFAKAALGGRWPSGTIQLDHRFAVFRPLRRGEHLTIDARIGKAEVRNGRSYFETVSLTRDLDRNVIGEQSSTSMWAGALPEDGSVGRETRARGKDGGEVSRSTSVQPQPARIGPIAARFSLPMLRAFGQVAGASDPIHVDPEFARGTRYGDNVVQGRLAMTLLDRLMLDQFGERWLRGARLSVRFARPMFVDQPVWAWAAPVIGDEGSFAVWCENARAERLLEGVARVGADVPAG